MNRRMRNRMYGGVRGRRGQPRPLLDLAYSRSEKLFCMIDGAVLGEAKLSQTGSDAGAVGNE